MTREEIITGLELIAEQYKYIVSDVAKGAIALLKAQEPVVPVRVYPDRAIEHYSCGDCGGSFFRHKFSYCPWCGKVVKWDD